MPQQPRLELTWIGKDIRPRLEPRILLEDSEKSYHAAERHSDADIFDNMLIHGDNLLALKALEQDFSGKVKCIYIDPPYNTGSAFEHYDDGVEHSLWLSLMRDRLEILWKLLSKDGSLWITVDDTESHYLKVLCDELIGRKNYLGSVVWEKDKGRRNDTAISLSHDYILIYSKDPNEWVKVRNLLQRNETQIGRYKNPDNDPRGPWLQGDNGTAKSSSPSSRFSITLPSGRTVVPSPSRGWSFSKENFEKALAEKRVYFGANGNGMPIIKRYLSEVQSGVVPRSWWPADEVGHNQEAKRDHLNKLLSGIEPFDTPKPERLIQRILQIATNPGDLVLDSFLGSGTTAAVAHKMGRRWIGIELGDHCYTHCLPRLKKVIDGEDEGGITYTQKKEPAVKLCKGCRESLCEKCAEKIGDSAKAEKIWFGGGGFRFYELAPSLIKTDNWGNPVINPRYNPEMLAEALCKLEGFTYAPDPDVFWQQGYSTERDFIYVTTQTLDTSMLEYLNDCVGEERSLLICCGACVAGKAFLDGLERLTVKKIPQAVLNKCEWDHDDYSLNISTLPQAPAAPAAAEGGTDQPAPRRRRRTKAQPDNSLLQLLPEKGE